MAKTIRGVKAGTTTISASYTDGGVTKTASVNFTVSQATGYLTATTTNREYNGNPQTIATIATNSGDYYFGFGSSTTSGPSSWGSKNTALSVKDAGTYYVWAKCDANTGYYNAIYEKYIGNILPFESKKNSINELTYLRNRNRPTDIENNLMVTKG